MRPLSDGFYYPAIEKVRLPLIYIFDDYELDDERYERRCAGKPITMNTESRRKVAVTTAEW